MLDDLWVFVELVFGDGIEYVVVGVVCVCVGVVYDCCDLVCCCVVD